jgi:hypothetical protein
MAFVELNDEIYIHPLLEVSEFVVFLDLYRKEHSDTLTIVIIDQVFLCVCVVNEPLQEFDTGKDRGSASHHM